MKAMRSAPLSKINLKKLPTLPSIIQIPIQITWISLIRFQLTRYIKVYFRKVNRHAREGENKFSPWQPKAYCLR